jgi:hypothetical protein
LPSRLFKRCRISYARRFVSGLAVMGWSKGMVEVERAPAARRNVVAIKPEGFIIVGMRN